MFLKFFEKKSKKLKTSINFIKKKKDSKVIKQNIEIQN